MHTSGTGSASLFIGSKDLLKVSLLALVLSISLVMGVLSYQSTVFGAASNPRRAPVPVMTPATDSTAHIGTNSRTADRSCSDMSGSIGDGSCQNSSNSVGNEFLFIPLYLYYFPQNR